MGCQSGSLLLAASNTFTFKVHSTLHAKRTTGNQKVHSRFVAECKTYKMGRSCGLLLALPRCHTRKSNTIAVPGSAVKPTSSFAGSFGCARVVARVSSIPWVGWGGTDWSEVGGMASVPGTFGTRPSALYALAR